MPTHSAVSLMFEGERFPALSFRGVEAISHPFQFVITVTRSTSFNTREMLGQPAGVRLQDAQGTIRDIRGIVFSINETLNELSLTLSPRLAAGEQAHNTRLFLGKSRREIVTQVLKELGYESDQIVWLGVPNDAHLSPPLLQANETQLAFVQRLLAELQCLYWFDSQGERELICLGTELSQGPMLPPLISVEEAKKAALNGEARPMSAFYKQPKPSQRFALTEAGPKNTAQTRDTFLPMADSGAELAARQSLAHHQAVASGWTLVGNYPSLTVGFGVEPPAHWRSDHLSEPVSILHCRHQGDVYDAARPELGLKYRISATLIPRASHYRPDFPAMPTLPMAFPATIESHHAFAELDTQGRYQFRFNFSDHNTELLDHTHASPPTARLVPFANADQPLATGWHFPLLDQSTVLVTLLNNDPNRPCIIGFAPSVGQEGPVTAENAQQSRIVTPGQNELTFDDDLPNVVLQTFDGQTRIELNAASEHQFIYLGAQYGLVRLTAGQNQNWLAQENLIQKHGGQYLEKVKRQASATTEGNRHLQAAKRQQIRASKSFNQTTDNHLKMQTKSGELRIRTDAAMSIHSQGAQLTKVANGSYRVQASSSIELHGTGQGNLTISNGTGGFKIDSTGNIKVFGKQVTLNGQRGVIFNGDVEYDIGAGNEPESLPALEPVAIEDIEPLISENTPLLYAPDWVERTAMLNTQVTIKLRYQNMEEGATVVLSIIQLNPDNSETLVEEVNATLNEQTGTLEQLWLLPKSRAQAEPLENVADLKPYRYIVKASIDGVESSASPALILLTNLELNVESEAGIPVTDGAAIGLKTADGQRHHGTVRDGIVRFYKVAAGPAQLYLENERHR